jgi:hypothetical protein
MLQMKKLEKKLFRITIALVVLVSFTLTSCSDDDTNSNVNINEISGSYISMKVDGELWVSEKSKMGSQSNFFDTEIIGFSNADYYQLNVQGIATNNFQSEKSAFLLKFDLDEPNSGTYSLPIDGDFDNFFQIDLGQWQPNGTGFSLIQYATNNDYVETDLPFNVTVTEITPLPNLKYSISGTFEGELKKEDGTIVRITEGVFKGEH